MAISLPDIVQRVVLDTRGFSRGNKALGNELTATTGQLGKASAAADKAGSAQEGAGKKTEGHSSSLKKLHSNVRATAPSLLRLSDNLYKVRTSHGAVAAAADKSSRSQSRLDKMFGKLRSTIFGGIKSLGMFGAKVSLVGGLILALTPILGGVVGGLGALIGSLGRSIGLLPALASGFVGLIAVLGTAKFLFGGLKDAMKEQTSAGTASASSAKAVAKAQESAAKAVEAAQKRVADAIRSVQEAAKAEAAAYTNIGVVHYEQSRKIADATRNVAEAEAEAERAKQDVTRAQEELNRAYETYGELIGELERDSKRASISERDAVLDIADARERLDKVNSDPEASANDRARAALDLETAELNLIDAQRRARETVQELDETRAAGAEGTDAAVEARNNLTEAERRAAEAEQDVADAEQGHFDASVDGWLAVIDAQDQAAEATQNTRDRMADLAEAQADVAEAARDGAEAIKEAAESGKAASSGGDKKKITAPMMALAAAIKDVKKGYAGLKEEGQAVAFPGAIAGIQILGRTFQAFKPQFLGTATVIGEFPKMLATGLASVQPEIGRVWDTNNHLMLQSSGLLTSIIAAGAKVADASRGVLGYFATSMGALSSQIATAANAPDAFQRMQDFFNRALMSALVWWHIVRDFTIGTIKFFGVGADAGDKMATGIADTMARFREWTDDDSNREKLATFFDRSREMLGKVAWFIGQIAIGFGAIASGPALPAMTGLLDKIFGGSQKDNGLAKFIEGFGNKAILGGVDAVSGLFDVFTGKKEASTNVELMATSFSRLSELGAPLEIFATAVSGMVDGILWLNENVPGFSTVMGGMLAVMAVGKMSGMSSLVKGLGNIGIKIYGLLQNRELAKVTQETRGVRKVLTDRLGPNVVEKELDDTARAARNAEPAIDGMGTSTTIAADKIERSGGRFSKFTGKLGGLVGKASKASGAVAGIGGAVWAASSLMGDSPMADTLNKIGAAMTMAGTVGELANSFSGLTKTTEGMTKATQASNAAMALSPWVWVAVAVAAVGAALYLLYKKSDTFRKFVDGLWQSIQVLWDKITAVLMPALNWLKDVFVAGLKLYLGAVKWYIEHTLVPVFKFLWQKGKAAFMALAGAVSSVWESHIKPAFEVFGEFFTNTLVPIFQALLPATMGAISAIGDGIKWVWESVIKPALSAFGWFFDNVLVPGFNVLRAVVEDVMSVMGNIISGIWTTIIKPAFEGLALIFTEVVVPAFRIVKAVVEDVMGVMGKIISGIWTTIIEPALAAFGTILNYVIIPAFNLVKSVAGTVFKAVGDIIKWAWEKVIKPIWDGIKKFVVETLLPLWESIKAKVSDVWDSLSGIISGAWTAVKSKLQIAVDWIKEHVVGIWDTLSEKVSGVWSTMGDVISTAFEGAKEPLRKALKFLGDMIAPFLRGAATVAGGIGATNLKTALETGAVSVAQWGQAAAGGRLNEYAAGTRFANAPVVPVGAGFKTGTPKAIVGEGSRHPEYVIPTDPKYRTRARSLLMDAARDMSYGPRGGGPVEMASGGRVDGPRRPTTKDDGSGKGVWDTVKGYASGGLDTLSNIADAARRLGAGFMDKVWPHVPQEYQKPEDILHWPGIGMEKVRNDVIEWMRGEAIRKYDLAQMMTGTATGLNPIFLRMFNDYSAKRGGDRGPKFSITSGFRTYAQQEALYNKHLRGEGNLAARPGTSNHERGIAIDHAPKSTGEDRSVAAGMGLHYPVPGEMWHIEPIDKQGVQLAAAAAGFGTQSAGGPVRDIARQALEARGWGGQWAALDALITRESGWNPNAKNPQPGMSAHGLGQLIDTTWAANGGGDRNDPATQIRNMLSYIASRHGDPNGAWDFWQRNHWYAKGGVLGDGVPQLAQGGIVTQDTLARIGEAGSHEAVIPLDSPRGRKMLGNGDRATYSFDLRGMQISGDGDPVMVKRAIKEGLEEVMDEIADLVEIGTR